MSKKPILRILVTALLFLFCASLSSAVGGQRTAVASQREAQPQRLIVTFEKSTPSQIKAFVHQDAKSIVKRSEPRGGFDIVYTASGESFLDIKKRYLKNLWVTDVEVDPIIKAALIPNDPEYSNQWAPAKIKAPQAWDMQTGASDIVIAIIDSGIDYYHEDLSGRVIQGYDYVNNDSNPLDDFGHGTNVAGVAAASTNNGKGIAGTAWTPRLMAIKVLDSSGSGYMSDVVSAIYDAADAGVEVINMSIGTTQSSSQVQTAIDYARGLNCVLVAAVGNDGNSVLNYPAACDHVLGVGATDSNNNRASFSNYNTSIDIAAPGVSIRSTRMGGGYSYNSGTSFSTPMVAGQAALLYSQKTGITASEADAAIMNSAVDLGSSSYDVYYGHGLIDLYTSLLMVAPAAAITGLDPVSGEVGTSVTITGTSFGATQGSSTVELNETNMTVSSWSNTQIIATVPAGATDGPVTVTTISGTSNGMAFDVTALAPTITNLNPPSGPVGTLVVITGTNFGATQGSSMVAFNGTTATPTIWSNTSISVTVPTGATDGNVVVTTAGGASNGVAFDVTSPVITPTRIETNYAQWPRSQRDVSWDDYGHVSYSGGVSMASKWTNDALTFTFTGSKLDVIGLKASNRGIADVYIDNVLVGQIDGYAPTLQFQVPIFTQTYASDQTHTLRIVVTGTHGASSSDNWIDVDAFDVTQGGVIKRYETCNGRWLGTFTGYRDSRYSYGSSMGAKDNSASCTFTFTGSRVDWITLKVFNRGIAQVYIDGVYDATIDCYSPTFDFQTLAYSKDFGSSGTHTIKVMVTGTKNPLATDYWVDVDAFDVYP